MKIRRIAKNGLVLLAVARMGVCDGCWLAEHAGFRHLRYVIDSETSEIELKEQGVAS